MLVLSGVVKHQYLVGVLRILQLRTCLLLPILLQLRVQLLILLGCIVMRWSLLSRPTSLIVAFGPVCLRVIGFNLICVVCLMIIYRYLCLSYYT